MPKLSGIFQIFPNLDVTPPQAIFRWIDQPISLHIIENALANRLLYPQAVPVTTQDMQIDLAILKEGIAQQNQTFYNTTLKQITIPEGFEERFKPTEDLVKAFIDALNIAQTTHIVIRKSTAAHLEGWVVIPQPPLTTPEALSVSTQTTSIKGQAHQATQTFKVIPDTFIHLPQIANCSALVKIDSQPEVHLDFGRLGLFIDTRPKKTSQ